MINVRSAEPDNDDTLVSLVGDGAFGSGSGIALPIPHRHVEAAVRLVDQAGIIERIAEWRQADRGDKHAGGRTPAMGDRAVLSLFVLLGMLDAPLFATRAAEAIAQRLEPRSLELLGVVQHTADGNNWYDRTWRATRRLLDVIDPFPGPRKWKMTYEEHEAICAQRDPYQMAIRIERLDDVANSLLRATFMMLPRQVRRRFRGNVCVDATPVVAPAAPPRSDRGADLDAGWYRRTADWSDPNALYATPAVKQMKVRKNLWAYEATLFLAVNNHFGSDQSEIPNIVLGMSFHRPSISPADQARTILQRFRGVDGYPAGYAIGDRAYWCDSDPAKLQIPVRKLGYLNVCDYTKDQLGKQSEHEGAIMVEGSWYCPSMPDNLINASIDELEDRIDQQTYLARLAERENYRVRPKEHRDANGRQPMTCPAVGPNATATCSCRPDPNGEPPDPTLVHITAPTHKGRICTNRSSVTFNVDTPIQLGPNDNKPTKKQKQIHHNASKYQQDIPYRSADWHTAYHEPRNSIEGFNAWLKDTSRQSLASPGRRLLRGRTAQHFFTAVLTTAANIRKIARWMALSQTRIDHRARTADDREIIYVDKTASPTSGRLSAVQRGNLWPPGWGTP